MGMGEYKYYQLGTYSKAALSIYSERKGNYKLTSKGLRILQGTCNFQHGKALHYNLHKKRKLSET